MSPMDCFRLLVLCFWLILCDVDCESNKKGYVVRVKAGQAPMGVRNDNKGHERWIDFRIPMSGNKRLDQGQNGNVLPAKFNFLKPGFNSSSAARGQSFQVHHHPEKQSFSVPDGKKYQAHSNSLNHGRGKPSRLPLVQVNVAQVNSGPENTKDLTKNSAASTNSQAFKSILKSNSVKSLINPARHKVLPQKALLTPKMGVGGLRFALYASPRSFKTEKTNLMLDVAKETDGKTESTVKEHYHGSNSEEISRQMPNPQFGPRGFSRNMMAQIRGYSNTHRFKPASDKPQGSSTIGSKFLVSHILSGHRNQGGYGYDSRKPGFGLGVPASQDRHPYPTYNSQGRQHGNGTPPPNRAQVSIEGKFKPFQTLPDLPAHTHPADDDKTPAETTLPPSLNTTVITSAVVLSTSGELSTKSSPEKTEGQDADPEHPVSEDQSESSANAGPSVEEEKQIADVSLSLQEAEKGKGDGDDVSTPPEID